MSDKFNSGLKYLIYFNRIFCKTFWTAYLSKQYSLKLKILLFLWNMVNLMVIFAYAVWSLMSFTQISQFNDKFGESNRSWLLNVLFICGHIFIGQNT